MPSPKRGTPGSAVPPAPPKKPIPADVTVPGGASHSRTLDAENPPRPHKPDEEKTSWIEIELVDEDDQPVPGERYRITLPDGSVDEGTLDENGFRRVQGIDPGTCEVTFPNLDKDAWEKL